MKDIDFNQVIQDADKIKQAFCDIIDYTISLGREPDQLKTRKGKELTIRLLTKVMYMTNLLDESNYLYEQIKDAELNDFLDEIFNHKS